MSLVRPWRKDLRLKLFRQLLYFRVAAHAAVLFNSSSHTQGIAQASSGGNRITRYSSAERRKGRQVKKFEYRKYDFKIPAASSVPFR